MRVPFWETINLEIGQLPELLVEGYVLDNHQSNVVKTNLTGRTYVHTYDLGAAVEWKVDDNPIDIVDISNSFETKIQDKEYQDMWHLLLGAMQQEDRFESYINVFNMNDPRFIYHTKESYKMASGNRKVPIFATFEAVHVYEPMLDKGGYLYNKINDWYRESSLYTEDKEYNVLIADLDAVMLVREPLWKFDDPCLHKQGKRGVYGWEEIGCFVEPPTDKVLFIGN